MRSRASSTVQVTPRAARARHRQIGESGANHHHVRRSPEDAQCEERRREQAAEQATAVQHGGGLGTRFVFMG